jgi:hypothetical protein
VSDLLMSADMLVDDATKVLRRLERTILLPTQRPSWHQDWDGWGFEAYWCRVRPDLASSPTRFQVISPLGEADPSVVHHGIGAINESPKPRPIRAHSTPIGVSDFDGLVARLTSAGCAFRVDAPDDIMSFPRLWMGRTDVQRPELYDATSDGGLFLGFIPTYALGMPAGTECVGCQSE